MAGGFKRLLPINEQEGTEKQCPRGKIIAGPTKLTTKMREHYFSVPTLLSSAALESVLCQGKAS